MSAELRAECDKLEQERARLDAEVMEEVDAYNAKGATMTYTS